MNKYHSKYQKYKAKYLESKNIPVDSIIKNNDNYIINKSKILISDTSSIMPISNKNIN